MGDVKLHGRWPSPYSFRVIWALKLKGIPYEYAEEDLANKSSLLLQYNPVHKKIPVLVHGGKPICESLVIIEYIDEMWPQNPLLPTDPYDRARARFWTKFADEKGPAAWTLFRSSGQELEKGMKDTLEMLEIMEEQGLGEKKYFHGDHNIGIEDIVIGSIVYWLEVIQEARGVKLFESQKFPRLYTWLENFKQVPILKENLPNHDEMVAFFKRLCEKFLASA